MTRLPRRLVMPALVMAMTGCSGPSSPDLGPRIDAVGTLSEAAADLLELTNAERARAGLIMLRANARLMRAAQMQAEQVAAAGRLEHTLSSAPHPTLEDRLVAAGYAWQAAGENLAFGQRDAAHALQTWMQSSGHRANVLNGAFAEMGAGYVVDRNGRPYYVQVFGRPRESQKSGVRSQKSDRPLQRERAESAGRSFDTGGG